MLRPMKKTNTIDDRPAVLMPVSHRVGAPPFGKRGGREPPTSSLPAPRALNSSTVLILTVAAFSIPATMFGLFADGSGAGAPVPPAVIGLRGSLPAAAQEK
jgi:hypothetical protein